MPKRIGFPDVPWITAEGYIDLTKIPLDDALRRTVSGDPRELREAVSVLRSAAHAGRREAGVFLLGLLSDLPPDAPEDRTYVVEALGHFETESSAGALFGEIRRVKSSNATRRYLDAVFRAITMLPAPLVREGLEKLAGDTTFSYRMRAKFRDAVEQVRWDERHRLAQREPLEASDEPADDEQGADGG
jgi:hypothetical protein